jgi:hypothetical protein
MNMYDTNVMPIKKPHQPEVRETQKAISEKKECLRFIGDALHGLNAMKEDRGLDMLEANVIARLEMEAAKLSVEIGVMRFRGRSERG